MVIGTNLIRLFRLARRRRLESIMVETNKKCSQRCDPKKKKKTIPKGQPNLPAREGRLRKLSRAKRIQVKSVGRCKINLTAVGPYSGFFLPLFFFF